MLIFDGGGTGQLLALQEKRQLGHRICTHLACSVVFRNLVKKKKKVKVSHVSQIALDKF